ncbi:MAG: N-acetylmuramoyl-L-alanine amidase, partial [Chloroflexi bacterium]|nr:N-acetylmuramoyl-L-alanine amidase [Chloroflexota bacterium]
MINGSSSIFRSWPGAKTIYLDPGHGGIDSGAAHRDAQGHVDLEEKNLSLAVAKRLAELLNVAGYNVLLSRDGDYTLTKFNAWETRERIKEEAQARVDLANDSRAALYIALHFNGYSDPRLAGTQTYYCRERPFAEQNRRLALLVQASMLRNLRSVGYLPRDRGAKEDRSIGKPYGHLFTIGANADFARLHRTLDLHPQQAPPQTASPGSRRQRRRSPLYPSDRPSAPASW